MLQGQEPRLGKRQRHTFLKAGEQQEGRQMRTECTHLLQGLHELFYWDGAAQQRLQHFAVWNVITRPLSLLSTCGLGGPGWGLEREKTPSQHEGSAGHSQNLSVHPTNGPSFSVEALALGPESSHVRSTSSGVQGHYQQGLHLEFFIT